MLRRGPARGRNTAADFSASGFRLRHHPPVRHAGDRGPAGGLRHAARQRMHQRPWRMRHKPTVAALDGGDGNLYRERRAGGVPGKPRAERLAMKANLVSLLCGIVFAIGLGISGMTRPSKVIGFLDFAGAWDLSLAFVMIGAICVFFVAYRLSRRMRTPLLAAEFSIQADRSRRATDFRLRDFRRGMGVGGI